MTSGCGDRFVRRFEHFFFAMPEVTKRNHEDAMTTAQECPHVQLNLKFEWGVNFFSFTWNRFLLDNI